MKSDDLHSASIVLPKGANHILSDARGHRIETISGCLWVTIDNDLRDAIVTGGDSHTIDRQGRVMISAMDDSRFMLLEPTDESPAARAAPRPIAPTP